MGTEEQFLLWNALRACLLPALLPSLGSRSQTWPGPSAQGSGCALWGCCRVELPWGVLYLPGSTAIKNTSLSLPPIRRPQSGFQELPEYRLYLSFQASNPTAY